MLMLNELNAEFLFQTKGKYLSALHSWVCIFKIIVMQISAYVFRVRSRLQTHKDTANFYFILLCFPLIRLLT